MRARVPSERHRRRHPGGFTLTELLIVIAIVLIVSIVTLPVVLPTVRQRNVNAAALLLQGELARAKNQAVRTGYPAGFRLLPEPPGSAYAFSGTTPAYSRMIALEAGPFYREGTVTYAKSLTPAAPNDVAWAAGADELRYHANLIPIPGTANFTQHPLAMPEMAYSYGLVDGSGKIWRTWQVLFETKFDPNYTVPIPTTPTSWFWNIRRGDRIHVNGGPEMVIVGPMLIPKGPDNPEGYINYGLPSAYQSVPGQALQEFLVVLNGKDDDGDGVIDEAYDGIDNDGDGVTDPGFDGLDNDGDGLFDEPDEMFWSGSSVAAFNPITGQGGEYESEGDLISATDVVLHQMLPYEIPLGAIPARGARELVLPGGMWVDMTTWNAARPERSRLPVDPATGFIDIMVSPSGQLVRPVGGKLVPYPPDIPFIHFWLADTDGIQPPELQTGVPYQLPLPEETPMPNAIATADTLKRKLVGNRRLVTVNTRTGQITTTSLEYFDLSDYDTNPAAIDKPYLEAQAGLKGVD